ncbi:MAG: NAD(P)-dependent glycerol-3-phosphate dehydrogenase [Oscillospiraceae bacterium]|nr:NAD(P)-dependent glycerol-3-phosphate dehydrogenase [Oscillospiraceae bacterium]
MKITVAGSGAWGTALAICLCNNGHEVTLWSHNPDKAAAMDKERINPSLKGVVLPEALKVSGDAACIEESSMVVVASPSFAIRGVCRSIKPHLRDDVVLVSVTKGIEPGSLLRMSQIVEAETGKTVVALTGPSHAEEVSRGVPTAVVAACPDKEKAELVQDAFISDNFRVYTSPDIVGAELGGAVKNVIALCAGVVDGMGCGDNTKAMLMTRGLTEMARLGVSLGATKESFSGLSGVGDLIVTCTSQHSRNNRAGRLIGSGLSVAEAMEKSGGVVEGYYAAKSVWELAKKQNVDMPIINAAYSVLYENHDTQDVITLLMQRRRKAESEDLGWL